MSDSMNAMPFVDINQMIEEGEITIYEPKYDTQFEMNISGLTIEGLADHLYIMSQILRNAAEGCEKITADFDVPFINAWIEHTEDDEEGSFCRYSIIDGIERTNENEWTILLNGSLMEVAESGESISEHSIEKLSNLTKNLKERE